MASNSYSLTENPDYLNLEHGLWSTNDATVQSYRSNMLASQSLLLAVAALFSTAEEASSIVLTVCIIGLFNQWAIWFPVIYARARVSDYHKFNLLTHMSLWLDKNGNPFSSEPSEEEGVQFTEERFVTDFRARKKAREWVVRETNEGKYRRTFRDTRLKLDLILPGIFTILWLTICTNSWNCMDGWIVPLILLLIAFGIAINTKMLSRFLNSLKPPRSNQKKQKTK